MSEEPALPRRRSPVIWPVLLAALTITAYGILSTLQWRTLQAPSWDLGIFTQLAKDYGGLRAPIVPIKGDDVNLLGDHFHPILVLLAPVWWIWPSGLALLWTQAVLLGASAIPLTRLAMDRLGAVRGGLAGAAYALSFGLQGTQAVQFHEVAFAVPLVALSLTALLRERIGLACLWAAPLVFVKEDLGLTVLLIGAVIAWRHHRYRLEGIGLACWGAGWFLLSTFLLLPWLNREGRYDYTDRLGSPLDVLVPAEKWGTVILLLCAAGVIGARSPLITLMLPTLAWRFTGTVEFYWGWLWHYNAVLMPIAIAALIDACVREHPWARGRRATPPTPEPRRREQRHRAGPRRWITPAVLSSCAATLVLLPNLPLAQLADPGSWRASWRLDPAMSAVRAAPEGSVVAGDITLLAYLVPEHDVQWIHGPNQRVPDCVVVDDYAFSWTEGAPPDAAQWAHRVWQADYDEVYSEAGFQVACRPGS